MKKLAVYTLKTNARKYERDEEVLEALMSIFEAFNWEVVGELTYEDVEDKDDV